MKGDIGFGTNQYFRIDPAVSQISDDSRWLVPWYDPWIASGNAGNGANAWVVIVNISAKTTEIQIDGVASSAVASLGTPSPGCEIVTGGAAPRGGTTPSATFSLNSWTAVAVRFNPTTGVDGTQKYYTGPILVTTSPGTPLWVGLRTLFGT